MKKVKEWIKNHKKEIIVGTIASGGTALYFLLKEKKINGLDAALHLTLKLTNENEPIQKKDNYYHSSISLSNPNLTISDLGKLGDLLKESQPLLNDVTKIDYLSFNYHKHYN